MYRFRYILLFLVFGLAVSWQTAKTKPSDTNTLVSAKPFPSSCDSLSKALNRDIDSIEVQHSYRLPYGSTPSLQIYNDSILLASYDLGDYTRVELEANEYIGLEERFFNKNIYLSDKHWQSKRLFSKSINSNMHETHPTISAGGNLIVFVRTKKGANASPRLFYAVKKEEQWKVKGKLIFDSFNENIIASYPFLTPKDDLYFSAIISTGNGKMDIYKTKRTGKFWESPTNLGSWVNTRYDETSPILVGDSLLFFASNRPGGFGGFDLYMLDLADSASSVVNLGPHFNTSYDDLYFVAESETLEHGYIIRHTKESQITPELFNFTIKYSSPDVYTEYSLETIDSIPQHFLSDSLSDVQAKISITNTAEDSLLSIQSQVITSELISDTIPLLYNQVITSEIVSDTNPPLQAELSTPGSATETVPSALTDDLSSQEISENTEQVPVQRNADTQEIVQVFTENRQVNIGIEITILHSEKDKYVLEQRIDAGELSIPREYISKLKIEVLD